MAEFMMLMKGAGSGNPEDWTAYIKTLVESGLFRGGSELGNGSCSSKAGTTDACTVTGFMRFEAETREQVMGLLQGNPVFEAGGTIEVLEIVVS